jgi:hypothetical protein
MQYFYQTEFKTDTEIFPKIRIAQVKKIPIKRVNNKIQTNINLLVDYILEAKSQGKVTTHLENQIDNLVYRLYDLTYDEVKVIDPQFNLTEEEYKAIALD